MQVTKYKSFGITAPALFLAVLGSIFAYKNFHEPAENTVLPVYAQDVLEKCKNEKHRPSCYDKEIPKLMSSLSMEEAFQVTRLVQEKDQNYWYCHVLGHEISAKETAKDPSQWKDVVARCPSGMCSNGCIHGAFQEKFRVEAIPNADISILAEELGGICVSRPGWNPTGMERGTCYHALGHLAMYVTSADTTKSLRLCDVITQKENSGGLTQVCYDGVFMQIFQPLEPEDFALVEGKQPTKESVHEFCWSFSGKERGACWSESWPLFFNEVTTASGLTKFCSVHQDPAEENRCFVALFHVLTAQFNFQEPDILKLCQGLSQERKGQCFANAAARFIETDARLIEKSISLCRTAASMGVGDICFQELLVYSTYNFHKGSEPYLRLCNSMPGEWKEKCLNRR